MNNFKTNIVLKPESNAFEITCGVFIVLFIFTPFILGFILHNKWLFLSLPMGVVLVGLYNLATNGKFNPKNWIQKDFYIEFNLTGIRMGSSAEQKEYGWSAIEGTDLRIEGYDGESRRNSDDSPHTGLDNKITFTVHGIKHEILFYLKNAEQKENLKQFLWNKTLEANMDLSVKDQDTPITTDLKGFQRTRPEQEALAAKKKKTSVGCLIAFLSPFVLIGVGTLLFFFYQLVNVFQASSWNPVNANVLHYEIVYGSSSESSSSSSVEISYAYKMGNTSYTGHRFSFNVGGTNVENYGELYKSLGNAKVIQIYVDEDHPEESVVVRSITNGMIYMGIFSLMWNSLLMAFLLPLYFKKLEVKNFFIIVFIIWILGISKFVVKFGNIDIAKEVVVIESNPDNL